MKKKFFLKFFIFAAIGALVTMNSCKDYDDDINNLEKQVNDLKTELKGIQDKISTGAVITDVASSEDGVKVTLSDGKTFNLTNGINGTSGSVITANEDGFWYIDGVKSDKTWKGEKGEAGAPGKDGEPGKDGTYYYPNEDGLWYKVEGETENKTEQEWRPAGTITAVWENGIVTLHNVEGFDGPITIGSMAISYLTLIPDYVADQSGALPILNFAPLVTTCGEIAPSILVRYQVSPSNATEDQIDTENLYFKYNNPKVMTKSTEKTTPVKFESLEDGILTVSASIDTDELNATDDGNITQLMLIVPLNNDAKVNSDWAKVVSNPIEGLALVRDPSIKDEKTDWEALELTSTAEAAKALEKTNLTVLNLAYDEELDLLEVVKTMIKKTPWADFSIDTYNLEYAFDLNDEEGKEVVYELGANKTDQQKFINLVGSKVTTRVYDLEGQNPAAIDRTPIVHVYLKSKDDAVDCNVLDGFIKVNIVETKVEPVPPVEINVEGKVEAGCENFTLKVDTKDMNEKFYAVAKVSKDFFHANYVWAEETEGIGTIAEVTDPEDTQSYNLVWTVTQDELADNVNKHITKSGIYTYGPNVIKVTFKANVTQPQINLSGLLLENYWDAGRSYIVHNVAVPDKGAIDPALNTFDTNINNAFKTNDNALLDLASLGEEYQDYNYEYLFDKKENQPVKSYNGITVSVSEDGKQLLATKGGVTETVATIQAQADGDGDILSYNAESALGKELLNAGPEHMKARIYIQVKNECDKLVKVNGFNAGSAFNIHFMRPVNVAGKSADNFVDGVDFGAKGSHIDIKKVVQLSDWRNYAKDVTSYNFEDNENYYNYYDVKAITVDKENIVPKGLIVDGKELDILPTTILIDQTANGEVFENVTYPFGRLTYRNNGANLKTEFTLVVPVTVEYKWGKVTTKVEVAVKATSATRSASN